MGPSIFFIFIVFIIWFSYENQKSTRKSERRSQNFWKREHEANSVRKKPTNQIHYITVSEKSLPFIEIHDEILDECQKKLEILKEKQIANFTGKSNTDLKLEYGVANLPFLQELDENYILLMRTLKDFSLRLIELGYEAEAKQALEFAIENGADSPAVYRALLDIYETENDSDGIEYLAFMANKIHSLHRTTLLQMFE